MTSRPRVAPYLTVSPAYAAIAFYATVFGAQQKALMPALDGLRVMHCELEINGGAVMLADVFPEMGNTRVPIPADPATVTVSLEYDDPAEIEAIQERALSLGGRAELGPMNSFWGTRFCTFRDPFGHRWMLNAPLNAGG